VTGALPVTNGPFGPVTGRLFCSSVKIGNRPVASQPLQKGGYAGSRRRTVIGLVTRLSPTHKKCGRACNSVVQQGFDLLWVQVTTSAECKKVSRYSMFREGAANAAGKEPIEALINM
jgi:hypothetical protein